MFACNNKGLTWAMKVAYYLNCVSTHELPVVREMVKLVGFENVLYVDAGLCGQAMQTIKASDDIGVRVVSNETKEAREAIETWDVVVTGIRDLELFKRRQSRGLKTFYGSERWFKPWHSFPGLMKMLVPGYRRMVKRFVDWMNSDPNAFYLAEGPWAKKDFLKMGVRSDKIFPWGYFVAPSESKSRVEVEERKSKSTLQLGLGTSTRTLKVLWAGRDIPLKHVRDIARAVALANKKLTTTVQLHSSTSTVSSPISFTKLTGVTPAEVRKAMREHDTFVFASNAYEGWGAVVSEALEEGMNVIGTYECGSCPAMLPKERLYHCGDVKALKNLLEQEFAGLLPQCSIGDWTAEKAAQRLLSYCLK